MKSLRLGAAGAAMGTVLLMLALASGAQANHIAGATYTGTAATGGTVELDVSPDGANVTRFAATDVPTTCGTVTTTATGNNAITDHSFSKTFGQLHFSGSFPSTQQASGELSLHLGGFPSCNSDSVAWNASTTASPPAPPPSPGPSPPSQPPPPPSGDQACTNAQAGATDAQRAVDSAEAAVAKAKQKVRKAKNKKAKKKAKKKLKAKKGILKTAEGNLSDAQANQQAACA